MGVPRGTLGKLDGFSHQTATRGMAQTQIYATVPQTGHAYGMGGGGASAGQGLATSIHRGSPPATSYSSGSNGSWSGGNMNAGGSRGGPSMGPSGGGASMGSGVGRSGGGPAASAPAAAPVAVHR
jgi:hypothetical protein